MSLLLCRGLPHGISVMDFSIDFVTYESMIDAELK